jgi:hypothetical protein
VSFGQDENLVISRSRNFKIKIMRIGSKVICIDDSLKEGLNIEEFRRDFKQWVKKGEEYTIRSIDDNDGIVVSVLLEEIKNPIRYFKTIGRFKESSFKIDRFREIEEAVVSKSETLKSAA